MANAQRPRRARVCSALVSLAGVAAAAVIGVVRVEEARLRAAEQRAADLLCLARNVYYEARGEPLVGQYAVAEVTMNRVGSPLFPDTVCGVVHSRGAFSWTYAESLPLPNGYEWRRAKAVASTVYGNREAPLVNGALFYHATYVSPEWAAEKNQVALIGRHIFYL